MDRAAPSSENLLLGKGQLFFDRFDANGVSTGRVHMGNIDTFEITTSDDNVEKYSAMSAGAPLYKRVNRKRTVTCRVTGDEFNADNLALMIMGSKSVLAQAATPVVDEALAPATVPGAYYKTAKLGPISAVTMEFGGVAGVLNTDYAIINADVGLVRVLPGTALTGAVTISYTPTAYTDEVTVVSGGDSGIVQGSLLFIGDPSAGPKVMVEVWSVSVTPDGALGLISEDFAQLSLNMAVQADEAGHPDSPLYNVTYLPD